MIVDNQPTESQTAQIQGQPEGMQLEQDESDWSDVEENRKVPVDMKVQEDGPALGEVKSRHEVRLAAFKEMETDAERATRLNVTSTDGPLIKVGNLDIVVEDRIILAPVEKIILNIENVVITKDRKIIGLVEDVFGPVERPKYSILNDQYLIELLSSGNLKVGDPVFCLATGMKALTEDQIYLMRAQKGCDASNKFDEEPIGAHDKDDIHYSDDENEISGSKSGMLGKRNRKMDEEDWKSNRVSQSTISALKEKHSQSVNQGSMGMVQESFPMAYNSQFPPQQFIPAHPGMYYPPQGAYPDYQQGMFVPMMTHMGPPDHQLSYQQYLAQINMMYGYPQGTQTSYGPGPQIHQTEEQLPQGETPQNEEPK